MIRLNIFHAFSALALLAGVSASSADVGTSSWSDWSQWTSPAPITAMGPQDSLLWMSTKDGLARIPIEGGPVTVYTTRNSGIPFDTLTSVDVSYEGEVLMGSPQGAIVKGENGSWTAYTMANAPLQTASGKGPRPVSGFAKTPDGNLWIATQAYAKSLEGQRTDFNQYPPKVSRLDIFDGNAGMIHMFDGLNWVITTRGSVGQKYYVESMFGLASDGKGRIWGASQLWSFEQPEIRIYQSGTMSPYPNKTLGELRIFPKTYPQSWISGLQATHEGMWASFCGTVDGLFPSFRTLLFFPTDTVVRIGSAISLDSLPASGVDSTHPTRVFALDTNGNPGSWPGMPSTASTKRVSRLEPTASPKNWSRKGPSGKCASTGRESSS
jgi:hypothetical protein